MSRYPIATREEARAHAVEKNPGGYFPFSFVAVYGTVVAEAR